MQFYVVSDLHYYDKRLGIESADFKSMCKRETKVLQYSEEICDHIIQNILVSDVKTVFFTGDFTANGEISCHTGFLKKLAILRQQGVATFIIPGNHDFGKQNAFRYPDEGTPVAIETFSKEDFFLHYQPLIKDEAISFDKHSFSYLIELADAYCFCLDSVTAAQDTTKVCINGAFYDETLDWITEARKLYCTKDKPIMAVMHHGLLPHFPTQEMFFAEYLVHDRLKVRQAFFDNDIRIVLTGHHHANSVVSEEVADNGIIFDIQCGSPLTYPLAYKHFTISDEMCKLHTIFVRGVEGISDEKILAISKEILVGSIINEIKYLHEKKLNHQITDEQMFEFIIEMFLSYYAGTKPPVVSKHLITEYLSTLVKDMPYYPQMLQNSERFFTSRLSGLEAEIPF